MGVGAKRVMPRLRNGRFPVRSKLIAVLLLPVVLLLALGISQVVRVREDAQEARAESSVAAAVAGPGSFLNLVVDERNHTAVYLLGAESVIRSVGPGRYLETRELVDEARQEFLEFVAGQDELVQAVYAPATTAVAQLDQLRADVDAATGPRDFQNVAAVQDLFARFGEVTGPLFEANRRVSLIVTEPDLQRGAALVDQALRQSDTIALLTYSLVVAALAGDADGVNTGDEYVAVATLLRDLRAGEQLIRLNAEGEYAELVDALFASEHVRVFPELVESALDTGIPDVSGLFANAGNEDAFGYDKLREEAEARIDAIAGDIDRDARRTQTTFTVVGLLVLLVLAVVTTLVARSITRPLRSLTQQAMSMADERLPRAVQDILDTSSSVSIDIPRLQPIDIHTRDEVADVAQALTTVQESALRLAVEQAALRRNTADSFVHLGRRNQTLLGRQLDFITELEQGETDPTALSNLFRLDHLATRMRRNAESLLVLAGVRPPRVWRVPMQIADIVRAALGEVENYHRVELVGVEPAAIAGSAAADLAHLLAELIENALTFSPPHQRVEVSGRFRQLGPYAYDRRAAADQPDDGGFTITITDTGIGMTAEDVARANLRLAGNESFAIAPSQYLGHYVAGMIAQRHDITVRMDSDGVRGTRATVTLPPSLLSDEGTPPAAVPVAHWTFASPAAAPAIPPPPPAAPLAAAPSGVVHVGRQAPQPAPAATGTAASGVSGHDILRAAGVIDTIVEAQRARYVRDTLSRLSDGLAKGRGAVAREWDERDTAGGAGAEASPGARGQDRRGGPWQGDRRGGP
jgi:signal transduction histidine kinase